MRRQDLATLLNGRQYGDEITDEEDKQAKENGLIVIFGYSDDNIELRGSIYDEIGAYGGTEFGIKWSAKKNRFKVCNSGKSECKFKATYYPWMISTNIPHSTFDIMEDGDLFCRGLIIDENDILNF